MRKRDDAEATAMRQQTAAYVQAVLAAHPELNPELKWGFADPPLVAFDPYPVTPDNVGVLDVKSIISQVASKYGLSIREMLSNRRQKILVQARQEAMYLAYKYSGHSLPVIGRLMGNRDHTTVLHGIRQFKKRMTDGKAFDSPWWVASGQRKTKSGSDSKEGCCATDSETEPSIREDLAGNGSQGNGHSPTANGTTEGIGSRVLANSEVLD